MYSNNSFLHFHLNRKKTFTRQSCVIVKGNTRCAMRCCMPELSELMNSDDEIEKQPAAPSHFLGCCLPDSSGAPLQSEDTHVWKNTAEENEGRKSRGEVHLKNVTTTEKRFILQLS